MSLLKMIDVGVGLFVAGGGALIYVGSKTLIHHRGIDITE